MMILMFHSLDLQLHATGTVQWNGADEEVVTCPVQPHGGVPICELRGEGLRHGAHLVVVLRPHLYHVVHFLRVGEPCCHEQHSIFSITWSHLALSYSKSTIILHYKLCSGGINCSTLTTKVTQKETIRAQS